MSDDETGGSGGTAVAGSGAGGKSAIAGTSGSGLGTAGGGRAGETSQTAGAGGTAGGGTTSAGTSPGGTSPSAGTDAGGAEAGGAAGAGGAGSDAGGAAGDGAAAGAPSDPCAADPPPANVDCCPNDPLKSSPGSCGCGIPDERDCLIHRYSFESADQNVVADLVGSADATLVNSTLSGGALQLAGVQTDQYLSIKSPLLSKLSSATVEVWVTWDGAAGNWQRIFDFGSSSAGAGLQGAGQTYLFVTPRSGLVGNRMNATFSLNGNAGEVLVESVAPMPVGTMAHIAVVLDSRRHELSLYLDGARQGTPVAWVDPLSSLNDVNDWVGRSQWQNDPEFGGQIHELRIYSAPLTADQLQLSFGTGPDSLPDGAGGAGGAGN